MRVNWFHQQKKYKNDHKTDISSVSSWLAADVVCDGAVGDENDLSDLAPFSLPCVTNDFESVVFEFCFSILKDDLLPRIAWSESSSDALQSSSFSDLEVVADFIIFDVWLRTNLNANYVTSHRLCDIVFTIDSIDWTNLVTRNSVSSTHSPLRTRLVHLFRRFNAFINFL